jgi:hypothetical protein
LKRLTEIADRNSIIALFKNATTHAHGVCLDLTEFMFIYSAGY